MTHGPIKYPRNHRPGMKVPRGGSSCSTCKFVSQDRQHCGNEYFVLWNGSDKLPAPADSYCSDWYEPAPGKLS